MNATTQAVDVHKEVGQWSKALMFADLILGLMVLASGAYASDGTEFNTAVTKWDGWMKGSPGKLTALTAIGVGSVIAAVKKDWSWFFGAVVLLMGIDMIVGIVDASFTTVI